MKDLLRLTVPIALIAAVSPGLADAQPVTRTFVKGTVTSAGKPARSVWVIISLNGREKGRSLTGDDGKYYIANLDPGTYDFVWKDASNSTRDVRRYPSSTARSTSVSEP